MPHDEPVGDQFRISRHRDPLVLDPLVVKRQVGAQSQTVPWLGCEIHVDWPLNGLPSARLPITLGDGFLVNEGSESEPNYQTIENALPDDQEVSIRTARGDPENDVELFRGYREKVRRDARGNVTGSQRAREKTAVLELVHVADCLRREKDYVVWGQCRRCKGAVVAGSAAVGPTRYTGLECVFNREGRGNCDTTRLAVPGLGEGEPNVPVFGEPRVDASPIVESEAWSWARVLVYLAYLGRRTGGASIGNFTVHDFRFWNLFEEATAERMAIDPDTLGTEPPSEPWERVLLGKPRSHVLEGLAWLDAWSYTCQAAGLGYVWEPRWADGGIHWGIRLFVPGTAALTSDANVPRHTRVRLPSPDYTVHDKPWTDILDAANVTGFSLVSDPKPIVNQCRMSGSTVKYEVTLELVPAWELDDWWDVDPDDGDAVRVALARLGGPAFRARYGASAATGLRWRVGRLWGANMIGDLDGYGRPWGQYDDDAYELFDLTDVEAGEVGGASDLCAVRRRPFEACVSGISTRTPRPPLIEASFDGGTTWETIPVGVRALRHDALIYFTVDNLDEVTAALGDNAGRSPAWAYIKGLLRVRVTAGLRGDRAVGDDTLGGQLHSSGISAANRARFRLLNRRNSLHMELREDVGGLSGGNSQFKGTDRPVAGRDNRDQGERQCQEFLNRYDRMIFKGPVFLPGLTFPVPVGESGGGGYTEDEAGYRPGDLVIGVVAEEGAAEHDYIPRPNDEEAGAVIAAVEWHYRSDPPAALTTLRLEDAGLVVRRNLRA